MCTIVCKPKEVNWFLTFLKRSYESNSNFQGGDGKGEHQIPRQRHSDLPAQENPPVRARTVRQQRSENNSAEHPPLNSIHLFEYTWLLHSKDNISFIKPREVQAVRHNHSGRIGFRVRRQVGGPSPPVLPETQTSHVQNGAVNQRKPL